MAWCFHDTIAVVVLRVSDSMILTWCGTESQSLQCVRLAAANHDAPMIVPVSSEFTVKNESVEAKGADQQQHPRITRSRRLLIL